MKSLEIEKRLHKLNVQKAQTNIEIEDNLSELPNYGGECFGCDDAETVDVVHHGNFDETITYCTKCGGTV